MSAPILAVPGGKEEEALQKRFTRMRAGPGLDHPSLKSVRAPVALAGRADVGRLLARMHAACTCQCALVCCSSPPHEPHTHTR